MTHAFVRGVWRREDETNPMILSKACHDLDLMVWSGFNLYSPTFVRGLRAGELPEMARAYGKAVNLAREAGFCLLYTSRCV